MIFRLLCTISLLVFLLPALGNGPDNPESDRSNLVGIWQGVGESDSGAMRFDLEFSVSGDSLRAEFILVDEGAQRLEAESVSFEDKALNVAAMGGAVKLEGRLEDGRITGGLQLPGGEMPIRMARKGSPEAEAILEEHRHQVEALREVPLHEIRSGPGMDSVDLQTLSRLLEESDKRFTTALALLHKGELVGEWYRGKEPRPVHAMSVTKAALNLVIGRLVTLGELDSVDVPVHQFYPQWAEDEKRSGITIRHLLAYSSGLDSGQPAGPINQSEDFVQFALEAPLEAEPGSETIYSNNGTNLLGGIVGRIIDEPLDEFLADDLFGLLGIEDFRWDTDRAGNPQGMAGLQLTAGDLARLGQLALDRGHWQGERLIDAEWFAESFEPATGSSNIGLIWFLEKDGDEVVGASHGGYLGQWLGIRLDEGIVGVRMVESSPVYDPDTDGFRNFLEMLPALVTDH